MQPFQRSCRNKAPKLFKMFARSCPQTCALQRRNGPEHAFRKGLQVRWPGNCASCGVRCGISIARTEPCVKLTSPAVTEKCKWCQKPDLWFQAWALQQPAVQFVPPTIDCNHPQWTTKSTSEQAGIIQELFSSNLSLIPLLPQAAKKPWICPDTPKRIDRYRFTQTGTQTHLKQLHEKIKKIS